MSINNDNIILAQCIRFWHCLSAYQKWGAVALIVLVFIVMVFGYKSTPEMTGGARLIRDAIIFCATIIGMLLAVWRLVLAERRLLDDRFANAAELMAKDTAGNNPKPAIAARTAGIYIMADLAMKKPKEFAEQVVKNLIAYIKDNAQKATESTLGKDSTNKKLRLLGGDIIAAFSVLNDILGNEAIRKHIGEKGEKALDFSQCDFSGLDFAAIDLKNDLRHYKKWIETKFIGCYLSEAHFADGADMHMADFTRATMVKAILKGADLERATFRGANLMLADMRGCYMRHARCQKTDDGTNTNLTEAKLTGAHLYDARFNNADMHETVLQGAMLIWAYLTGVKDLSQAKFGETYMKDATIDKDDINDLRNLAKSGGRKIWIDNADAKWQGDLSRRTNWRLEEYDDGYALAGVLRNFADAPYKGKPYSWALYPAMSDEPENIQRQATELEKLPDNTPEEIKVWLKEIKAKYSKWAV